MTDQHDELDTLFASARKADRTPSEALMMRVLTDAASMQVRPMARTVRSRFRSTWLDRLSAVFGGGSVLAGMSLAAVSGVFLGIVQPAPVAALTSVFLTDQSFESVELLPGDDVLWGE